MPHMLLVADDERFARPITNLARQHGYSSSCVRTLREARTLMRREPRDLMLLELTLPDGRALELLEEDDANDLDRVILLGDGADTDPSLAHLRPRVRDCLTTPLDLARIQSHLQVLSALQSNGSKTNGNGNGNGHHKTHPNGNGRHHATSHASASNDDANRDRDGEIIGYGPLIGRTEPMCQLYHMIARTAPTDANVLLVGESGAGKELVARLLHERSGRRPRPYLPLNCGAIPENLIEAELFGHEKGAFTGASQSRRGVFERAHRGTLLLDEITEMPADMQVRLLRVLETGEVVRIGGERSITVDVRIIAATNRSPSEAVQAGKLREDLLHRLAVVPIHVPPLRERDEDIELLAHHFLDQLNERYGVMKRITSEALAQLRGQHWPGNVRQLRNVLERAFIMADHTIDTDALAQPSLTAPQQPARTLQVNVGSSLASVERRLIEATLHHYAGDKRRTARTLGVSLKTLYNRLNSYKAHGQPVEV
ncbi:MAG: sigma-54 dependent transcriptional regulator [Phycisphaeraceae bacterium]